AASVVAVEGDPLMATAAEQTAKELGIDGIRQTVGPLEEGARPGPYDVILIEGAVQLVPQAIFDQLADGGRLTTVVAGPPGALGVAELFVKEGGAISRRALFDAGTPSLPGFAPPPRFTF
ncbi:MAG TPA: protein-L-isoaspartate O-methyltransferase, partial [Reyranella sp.]|nr:protein-L-isoaspartate O-methyltransferase [Reyranella sp.]